MAFDAPKLGGYTFINPPDSMVVYPEAIQQVNELADGSMKQRILGYRWKASLVWDANWVRSQDLTGIMAVANDASATLSFVPRPVKFPTRTFSMIWTNKFTYSYWNGKYDVWNGSIELVAVATTATVTELP